MSQENSTEILLLLPTDQWVSESNTFLTLLHSPLFLLSQILLLSIFWIFLQPRRARQLWLAAATIFLLALIHPYDLVTVATVLPIFLVARWYIDPAFTGKDFWISLRSLVVGGLAAAVPIAALLVAARIEPAIGGWAQQNVTRSPPLHSYLIGYGAVLLFAIPGILVFRRRLTAPRLLVLVWLLVGAALLYAPFQMNRRMTNGLHLALVILAAAGIELCWRAAAGRLPKRGFLRDSVIALFAWVLGFFLFFGTPATVVKAIYWSRIPSASIYHVSRPVADAMDWLREQSPSDAVILAHSYHGNILPARADRRVYIGHGHQTINWQDKRRLAAWFFRTNREDDAKHRFLLERGITHLFFSPLENAMGEYDPATKGYLVPVYTNHEVTIYRVLP